MNILSIGGSDPSAGAGIQSDIKTFSNHNAYGFTVVTAITSQNTKNVTSIEPVSTKSLKTQIDSILSDFQVDAIKIGMVYNSQIIKVINSKLRRVKVPIIVDPIIKSSTGAILLKKNARHDYKKMIIPLADIITPNRYEAKVLSGQLNANKSAKKIQSMGAKCVIITGVTSSNGKISDFVLEESKEYVISGKKIPISNHGSGCNYSASIAASLANGKTIQNAVKIAKNYVYQSIKHSKNIGKGVNITHKNISNEIKELSDSINHFKQMKNDALFINTGRGTTVDEEALINALQNEWIAGAGLDVLETEPPSPDNPLLKMDNVIITPHVASASLRMGPETRRRVGQELTLVLSGRWPRTCVNPHVLPHTKLIRWQPFSMERGPGAG